MTRSLMAALLVATALAATACIGDNVAALRSHDVPGAAVTVHILDSPESVGVFVPDFVRVQPGQTVAFVNASGDYHTITFVSGPVGAESSGGIAPGGTYETRLTAPGVYWYRCSYHPGMVGQIEVTAGPSPVPSPPVQPVRP